MFRRIAGAAAIAALALCWSCIAGAAAAPGPSPQHARSAESACPGASAMIADEASRLQAVSTLLCLVNRRRAAAGAGALRPSAPLAAAATAHSAEMVARHYFAHASRGAGLRLRAVRAGYVRRGATATLGETIAWGVGAMATPAQLMGAFLESPEHRRTLLYPKFRDAGVGLTLGAPMLGARGPAATLTVDFGRR